MSGVIGDVSLVVEAGKAMNLVDFYPGGMEVKVVLLV
jgi:hypothetical protein